MAITDANAPRLTGELLGRAIEKWALIQRWQGTYPYPTPLTRFDLKQLSELRKSTCTGIIVMHGKLLKLMNGT